MTQEEVSKAAKVALGKFDSSEFFGGSYDAWQMEDIFADGVRWALAHQWISVEQELPRPWRETAAVSERVAVMDGDTQFLARYNFVDKTWSTGPFDLYGVTHWMRLPEII